MTTEALLVLFAITTALGATLVAAAWVPTRPLLADILHDREAPASDESGRWLARLAVPLAEQANVAGSPADLELVGLLRESFVLQRLAFALGGALWIPALTALLSVGDVAPPLVVSGAASIGFAFVGWLLPAARLKAKAKQSRATLSAALASYCQLVALGRLGDRGPVEALRYPASLGSGWAFHRISLAIDEAALRGQMPWDGFEKLAESTGVRELKEVGQIISSAGQSGASIVDTLRAKATSITRQQLAERKTGASVRSDRMDMPLALMGLAFVLFLAFPGIYLMLHM